MATTLQQLQMDYIHMKQQSMRQLDYIYDARFSALQQQKRRMRLVIDQVIDQQLHQMVESLITEQCLLKSGIAPPIKHHANTLEVCAISFTFFSLFF